MTYCYEEIYITKYKLKSEIQFEAGEQNVVFVGVERI
jgi:hypothetical protein